MRGAGNDLDADTMTPDHISWTDPGGYPKPQTETPKKTGHANRKKRSETFAGLKPDARAALAAELRKLYEEGASLRETAARSSFPISVGGARTLILEADGTMRPVGGNHRKGGRRADAFPSADGGAVDSSPSGT